MVLITPPLPSHGGDLAAAERRWGRPAEDWLDLSTGINPSPYPLPALPAEAWTRLPGSQDEAALAAAAARGYRLAADGTVIAAPGSQALILALPRLRRPGPVGIVAPTYAEHGQSWAAAGHDVIAVADPDRADPAGVVVVVNPNNPDGRGHDPRALAALAGRVAAAGGLLVIDEAFADVRPDLSIVPFLGAATVVLRSFGKFHGLAGLRLGFALTRDPALAVALRRLIGPWAVSGPALTVGAIALADTDWAERTRTSLAAEQAALTTALRRGGLEVIGGTSLFTLVRHPEARRIWNHLGGDGILVRAFADHPERLRVGLPPGPAGLARLEAGLRAALA